MYVYGTNVYKACVDTLGLNTYVEFGSGLVGRIFESSNDFSEVGAIVNDGRNLFQTFL